MVEHLIKLYTQDFHLALWLQYLAESKEVNGREKGVDEPSTAYVNAVHYIMKEI
jgi:hypothetical protein